jgi:hypothetical protein
MRTRLLTIAAAAVLTTAGCYRVTVITGAPPADSLTTKPVDKPWQLSFVYGLVPPPDVDTKAECPQGFAVVQTERSFLNGLVSALSWSIFTPMHTKVTCAVGPVAK